MELVARTSHELRGPLAAARLGLHPGPGGAGLSEARLRAIDLELATAALALEDLSRLGSRSVLPARFRFSERSRFRRSYRSQTRAGVGLSRGTASAPEPVDLAALVHDSVEAWRAAAGAAGAELRLTPPDGAPARAWGDRLRLAQAVGNLIANAIEHGGGEVEVRCRPAGPCVRVEVLDGGPGLPAPVAELVARPRAGRGARGRGLAIAAGVAARHGGRLAAAPSEQGARLVLELPRADSGRRSA
jgi:signal transduction histidine kinase